MWKRLGGGLARMPLVTRINAMLLDAYSLYCNMSLPAWKKTLHVLIPWFFILHIICFVNLFIVCRMFKPCYLSTTFCCQFSTRWNTAWSDNITTELFQSQNVCATVSPTITAEVLQLTQWRLSTIVICSEYTTNK